MLSISSILLLVLLSVVGSQGEIQRKTKGYVEGGEVKPGKKKKLLITFIFSNSESYTLFSHLKNPIY